MTYRTATPSAAVAADLIIDAAVSMLDEAAGPTFEGFVAALGAILSADERPAATIIARAINQANGRTMIKICGYCGAAKAVANKSNQFCVRCGASDGQRYELDDDAERPLTAAATQPVSAMIPDTDKEPHQ